MRVRVPQFWKSFLVGRPVAQQASRAFDGGFIEKKIQFFVARMGGHRVPDAAFQ